MRKLGCSYYGARYLDPKTSRWLSADPALSDYIPGAPINDEVKKRNSNLPGMEGVFNTVNLHLYHYAGNNPVKYLDPNGREVDTIIDMVKVSIDIGSKLTPLLDEPNLDKPMSDAVSTASDIQGIVDDIAKLAKDDIGTFVPTAMVAGFAAVVSFDTGLVDSILEH
jgi:hypothetical protein